MTETAGEERSPEVPIEAHPGGRYVSTGCRHLIHTKCRETCKYCDLPCSCPCHAQDIGKQDLGKLKAGMLLTELPDGRYASIGLGTHAPAEAPSEPEPTVTGRCRHDLRVANCRVCRDNPTSASRQISAENCTAEWQRDAQMFILRELLGNGAEDNLMDPRIRWQWEYIFEGSKGWHVWAREKSLEEPIMWKITGYLQ